MSNKCVLGGLLIVMTCLGAGADRPTKNPKATRSVVMACNGMVATSQSLAVEAGIDVLKKGGNAIDAAIAVNAVLGVVEPMSCGIGGDLFVIVWDAKSAKLYGLNASGRSPFRATRALFAERGFKAIPDTGPLSWSVPGCVDGWDQLRRRFGSMELAAILEPAIEHAERGFPVTEVIGDSWRASEKQLRATPDAAKTFLRDGRAPRIGERMTNRFLAATYRRVAQHGRDEFYSGPIAREMVAFSENTGGLFSLRDFAEHSSTWVEPIGTTYRGYKVWELPPNGQGLAVLEMLNLFESYDIKKMGHNSADFLHLFIEAKKLAFADRARFYADLEFEKDLPIAQLVSKGYAAHQRKRIHPDHAAAHVEAGDPRLAHGDTVYLTVVDKHRNAVSFIQSNYFGWGSGLVPGDLGFCLQNRGTLFALDPDHANRLEPHKRPFHTIIPAMVTKDDKPWLSFGVMGGDMQPQGHVQVLCNVIDHGMNVQEAGDAARCQHFGSSTPTGHVMTDGGHTLFESGVSDATLAALRTKGHRVGRGAAFGGYQAILIDHENGVLHGGSDPRKDGCAIGY